MSFLLALLATAGPPELARPLLPQIEVISASSCDDPVERKRLLSEDTSRNLMSDAANRYNADWEAYLDARMERIGITGEEKGSFGQMVFESGEFQQLQDEGRPLIRLIMQDLEDVLSSKDELRNCKSIAHMTSILPQLLTNTERQWMVMDNLLDAEASKRGK